MLTHSNLTLPSNCNRQQTKDFVINAFLSELPGTGTGANCSKYIYTVETLSNDRKILLKRPATLNKGMDFTVHVEGTRFRQRGLVDAPSHDNIFNDLTEKSNADPVTYANVKLLINDVFNCRNITQQQCVNNSIQAGLLTTEEVIMAIKWLFIEQDVTYWNWSGRAMLFSGLQHRNLC